MSESQALKDVLQRAHRLKTLRKTIGLTMREFAECCNIGLTTVNHWEQGISKGLTERGARKVVEALRQEGVTCSFTWLMDGLGEPPKVHDGAKLVKFKQRLTKPEPSMTAAEQTEAKPTEIDETLAPEIEQFKKRYPEHLIVTIEDEAMMPFYHKGDVVGGKRLTGQLMELANDMDCIVVKEDGSLLVRRVTLGQYVNTFSLYCLTPEATIHFPSFSSIKIAALAPIIRLWRTPKY